MSEVGENVKSEKQWLRGLFMVLFVIILEMTKVVIVTVAIIQFLFAILTGKGNNNLRRFGSSLAQFAQQAVAFLTYSDEEKPFPFAPWPEPAGMEEEAEIEFGSSVETPAAETVVERADAAKENAVEERAENAAASTAEPEEHGAENEPLADDAVAEERNSGAGDTGGEPDEKEESDKKPGA